jgi:hypothetical protein
MAMAKDRLRYEKSELMDLSIAGESDTAYGDHCLSGTSASWGCGIGSSATINCGNGSSPGGACVGGTGVV